MKRRYQKTVAEKFSTKLQKLVPDVKITLTNKILKVGNHILFKHSPEKIEYSKTRYFPTLKEDIVQEDYTATILLDHETLSIFHGNICNPPRGVKKVLDMVQYINPEIDKVVVGGVENKISRKTIFITYSLYTTLVSIYKEEGKDKVTRIRNRVAPFLAQHFSLQNENLSSTNRDYSLLLKEIIASKRFSQNDIMELVSELDEGENSEIAIERQINKQAGWLLSAIQTIIDEPELSKARAQDLGSELFNFSKTSVSGPEDLMEKILSKYGQHIIFGVPALINTKKYVSSSDDLPKSQFDILLVTHLSDIEIVELKRPDEFLLDYDASRSKFYACKTLAIATAQSERYISALYRENDSDYKIDGVSIRDFLDSIVGETITLSICRPRALIVIGSIQRLCKPYESLSDENKAKVSKENYFKNAEIAYKEIRASFKNIDIITYSELLEGARLRLQLANKTD